MPDKKDVGLFNSLNMKPVGNDATGSTDPDRKESKKSKPLTIQEVIDRGKGNAPERTLPSSYGTGYGKLNKYDRGLLPGMDLNINRARNQTNLNKTLKTVGNVLPNIGLGLFESVGYAAELVSYGMKELADEEYKVDFSNAVTEMANAGKDLFGEAHRYNPNKVIDLGDVAWWLQTGSSLVESIAQFAIAGAGVTKGALWTTGKVTGALTKGAQSAKVAGAVTKSGNAFSQGFTAGSLAFFEGAMSGSEMFKQVYDTKFRETGDTELATQAASEAAATTAFTSTALVAALNLTGLYPIFKSQGLFNRASKVGLTRKTRETSKEFLERLAKAKINPSIPARSFMERFHPGIEAFQESLEEVTNVYAEQVGLQEAGMSDSDATGMELWFEALMTEEGALSAILGAIGGAGQSAAMMNLPMHKTNIAPEGETPQLKYLSAKQLGEMDLEIAGKSYAKTLESDIREIVTAQQELQDAVAEGDEAGMRAARNKLFSVVSKRTIPLDGGNALKASIKEIGEMDNSINILDQLNDQLAQAQGEGNQEAVTKLQERKEALEEQFFGEEIVTEAMIMGLAENTQDNEYKETVKKKLKEVDELKAEYISTVNQFNFGDEKALNMGEYVFDIKRRIRSTRENADIIRNQLQELETEIETKSSEALPEDLRGGTTDPIYWNKLQARIEALDENIKDLQEEKKEAEKGNRQILDRYGAQTKEQAVETIEESIKDTKAEYVQVSKLFSENAEGIMKEAEDTFLLREDYKRGVKALNKTNKHLNGLERRLKFVESSKGRDEFVKNAFDAYKSEVDKFEKAEKVRKKKENKEVQDNQVSDIKAEKKAEKAAEKAKKDAEDKKKKTDTKGTADDVGDDFDPNNLPDHDEAGGEMSDGIMDALNKGKKGSDDDIAGVTDGNDKPVIAEGDTISPEDLLSAIESGFERQKGEKPNTNEDPKTVSSSKVQYGNVRAYKEVENSDGTISKVTSSNERNNKYNPRLESKTNSLKGETVTIVSLEEGEYEGVVYDKGDKPTKEIPTDIDNKPMVIKLGDEVIGYLPTLNWISRKEGDEYVNVANYKLEAGGNNAEIQIEQLKAIRRAVDEKGSIDTTINRVSQGNLIYNLTEDGKRRIEGNASTLMPDPNLKIQVVRGGQVRFKDETKVVPYNDGTVVANLAGVAIPFTIGQPSNQEIQTILEAIRAKFTGNEERITEFSDLTKDIEATGNYDFASTEGLARFLEEYFFLSSFTKEEIDKKKDGDPNRVYINVDDRSGHIYFYRPNDGSNDGIIYTSNEKYVNQDSNKYASIIDEETGGLDPAVMTYIQQLPFNPDREKLNSSDEYVQIVFEDGKLNVKSYENYNQFAKEHLKTYIDGRNTIEHEDGSTEHIYFEQLVNNVNPNPILGERSKQVSKEDSSEDTQTKESDSVVEESKKTSKEKSKYYIPKEERDGEITGIRDLEDNSNLGSTARPSSSKRDKRGFDVEDLTIQGSQKYTVEGFTQPQMAEVVDSIVFIIANQIKDNNEMVEFSESMETAKKLFIDELILLYDEGNDILANNYEKILDSWGEFSERAISRLETIGYELRSDEDILEGENANYEQTKYDPKAKWHENSKDTASAKLKLFLSHIPEQTWVNNERKIAESPWLGRRRYVPMDTLYDRLTALFVDENPDYDNFIALLRAEQYNYAPFGTVAEQLENLPDTSTLKDEFTKLMSKQYVNMVVALVQPIYDNMGGFRGYRYKPINSNRNSAVDLVYQGWIENMKDSDLVKMEDGQLVIDPEQAKKLKEEYISELNNITPNKRNDYIRNFLAKLGVEMEDKAWESVNKPVSYALKGKAFNAEFAVKDGKPAPNTFIDFLFKSLPDEAPESFDAVNPLTDGSLKSRFRALASVQVNHSDTIYTSSYNDINGNSIYPYQDHTAASTAIRKLSTDEIFLERLDQTSFSKWSRWAKDAKSTDSRGVTLEYVDGVKNQENKKSTSGDKLGKTDNNLLAATYFFGTVGQTSGQKARFLSTTKSDKTMLPIYNAPKVGTKITLDDNGRPKEIIGDAKTEIKRDIMSEFKRIQNFKYTHKAQMEASGISIEGYMEGANYFILFPELNAEIAESYIGTAITQEEFNKVWDSGSPFAFREGDEQSSIDIMYKVVEHRLLQESRNLVRDWTADGLVNRKTSNFPDPNNPTKTVSKTYFTHSIDSKYIKGKDLKGRSLVPYTKPGSQIHYAAVDFTVNYMLNMSEEFKVISGDPALFWKGKEGNSVRQNLQSTIENINKRLAKDIAPRSGGRYDSKTFTMAVIKDSIVASREREQLGEAYGEMEITDAQEYTSVQEHLRNMKAEGRISPAQYDELSKVIKPGQYYEFSESQLAILNPTPTKPLYVGDEYFDTSYDVINKRYVKSSAFPLLPQFLKGFQLDSLRKKMEKGGIDRVSYSTANKVGSVNPVEIFEGRDIKQDFDLESSTRTLNREGFGFQQDVPIKNKESIHLVSQANKLIFNSVRNLAGFKFEDKGFTGRELELIKERIVNSMVNRASKQLYKDMGIEVQNGEMTIRDFDKIQKLLRKEGEKRNWSLASIEALELNEDGTGFILPLSLSPNASAIESLLLAQVSNITLKQEMHGYSYVQGSSGGLMTYEEFKNDSSGIEFTPTKDFNPGKGLEFVTKGDGKLNPAQVIVPWRFKDFDGNIINIEEFINEDGIIDNDRIPDDVLSVIGLRIPNQGHNSMLPMKIVGFLPPEAGTLAIVPEEIVAQMGSDFDVDKLYTYQPKSEYKMTADGGHRLERIKGNVFEVNSEEFIEIPSNAPVSEIESVELFTTKVDQFNYTFNPETGEVIHNAKKGDKVETRNTQIGKVLAAYSNENNLPTEEFNNQTYAKVGDRVVNVNNSNIVTDPNIVSKFDDSSDIEEGVDSIQQTGLTEDNQALLEDVLSSFEIGLGVTLVEDFGSKDRGQMASVNKNQEVKLAIDRITAESFIEYLYGEDETDSLTTKQKREVAKRLDAQGITREDVENLVQNKRDAVSFILLHEKSHVDNKDFQNDEIASIRDQLKADEITPEEYRMSEPMLAIETRATVDAFRELTQFKEDEVAPIFKAREVKLNYTSDQQVALSKAGTFVDSFRESGNRHFLLAGYAGTGKTTIAENIANYAISKGIPVTVSAPTNAAVEVVRNKFSGTDFKTLHSMLYGAPDLITGKWEDPKVPDNTLIIVDEASMIDQDLLDDIVKGAKRANSKIVFLGDSYQLEPVGVDPKLFENFDFGDNRTELQEVKRIDNDVLKVATHIRNTKSSKPQILDINNDDFAFTERFGSELAQDIKEDNDFVVLTTTNRKRVQNNNSIRRTKYGKESSNPIVDGETLVAVANNTKKNSQVFTVNDPVIEQSFTETVYKKEHEFHLVRYTDDTGQTRRVLLAPNLDQASLHGYQLIYGTQGKSRFHTFPFSESDEGGKTSWKKSIDIATYGYSLTIHKSQGSQWDNVYVEIPWMHKDWEAGRMIYTAITRAAKKVRLKETHYIQKVPVDQYRESRGFPIKSDQLEDALKYTEDSSLEAIDAFNSQPRTPRRSDLVRVRAATADFKGVSDDLLKNKYIEIFESVLSHPDMYENITSSLDKDDLQDVKEKVENVQLSKINVYAPNSYIGQRDYKLNQKSGNTLIGIYALANTLNSVIQDKGKADLRLIQTEDNKIMPMTIPVKLGNKKLELSTLSGEGTSKVGKETRTKGDIISLLLSAAVDNANENVLGPLNINETTANATVALALLEDDKGNSVGLDYIGTFTSQPIMRELVDLVARMEGVNYEAFISDPITQAIDELSEKYKVKISRKNTVLSDTDLNDMLSIDNIEKTTDNNKAKQLKVLDMFRQFYKLGQEIRNLQQAILAPATKGVENRVVYALRQINNAKEIVVNGSNMIDNIQELMTNVDSSPTEQAVSIDAIHNTASKLISELLPEYTSMYTPTIAAIEEATGKQYSNKEADRIWKGIKRYMNAHFSKMNLDEKDKDIRKLRERLYYGDPTHENPNKRQSIFDRVKEAKDTWASEEFLIKRLTVEQSVKASEVSKLEYKAAKQSRLDDSENTVSLLSMLHAKGNTVETEGKSEEEIEAEKADNKKKADLSADLILFDLATGGVQSPVSFSKYVPPSILSALGLGEVFNDSDYSPEVVGKQIIQHNPNLAKEIPSELIVEKGVVRNNNKKLEEVTLKPAESDAKFKLARTVEGVPMYPTYTYFFDKESGKPVPMVISKQDEEGVTYSALAVLGTPNKSEYVPGRVINQSFFNGTKTTPHTPVSVDPYKGTAKRTANSESLGSLNDILRDNKILENGIPKKDIPVRDFISSIALQDRYQTLLDMASRNESIKDYTISFTNDTEGLAGVIDPNNRTITLSIPIIDKISSSIDEVIAHELSHALTLDAIDLDPNSKQVKQLNALLQFVKRELLDQGVHADAYALSNVSEFAAMAISNTQFQKKINDMKFNNGTAFDRFKQIIMDLISSIASGMGITVKRGSVLENTIIQVVEIAEAGNTGVKPMQKELTDPIESESEIGSEPGIDEGEMSGSLQALLEQQADREKRGFSAWDEVDETVQNVVDALTARISNITRRITSESDEERSDMTNKKRQELMTVVDRLKNDRQTLLNENAEDAIIKVAKEQAAWVEKIAKDPTSSDALFSAAYDTAKSWSYDGFTRDFLNRIKLRAGNNSPVVKALREADSIMRPSRDTIEERMLVRVRDQINEGLPDKYKIKTTDELKYLQDSGILTKHFFDSSQISHQIGQYFFEIMASNSRQAESDLATFKTILKEKLEKLEGESLEDFRQLDSTGKWTGDLIHEYSYEYQSRKQAADKALKNNLRKARKMSKKDARAFLGKVLPEYHRYMDELQETVDTRILVLDDFNSSKWESRKDYIEYLEETYGKERAEDMVQSAETQYKTYLNKRDTQREIFQSEYNAQETPMPEDLWVDEQMAEWELQHSPLRALDEKFGSIEGRMDSYHSIEGKDHLTVVPKMRNKKGELTGFYDQRFGNLSDNQMEFYNFYVATVNQFKSFLPTYRTQFLGDNFFPKMRKGFYEQVMNSNLSGSFQYLNEEFTNSFTTGEPSKLIKEKLKSYEEIDPETKLPRKQIPIRFLDLKSDMTVDDLTFNISGNLELFAGMALHYKYMSEIEDTSNLVLQVARKASALAEQNGQGILNRDNSPVAKKNGAVNMVEMLEYTRDAVMYKKARQEYKPSNIQIFDSWNPRENNRKRARLRELEAMRDQADRDLERGLMSKEDYDAKIKEWSKEYEKIGGKNLVWGKVGDRFLEFSQLKGMGYNLTAGMANVGFGVLSNFTWAASGRDFTTRELMKAYRMVMTPRFDSGLKQKIAYIVKNFNVLFEVTETEFGKVTNKAKATDSKKYNFMSKYLSIYAIQRTTEFTVQASSLVAQMLHTKISVTDTRTGAQVQKNLFELMDNKGEWDTRYDIPSEWKDMKAGGQITKLMQFRNKVVQVNKYLHGNYDPNSPFLMKKSLIGRAIGQFRSWIPYGFKQRFGEEQYDRMLGRAFKGRYRTFLDIGFTNSIKGVFGSLVRADEFAYGKKGTTDRLEDIDIDNLKMALREMLVLVSLIGTGVLLKASIEDDDDSWTAFSGRILANQLYRVEQDIYFYLDPRTFEEILRNPIAAIQVYKDFARASGDAMRYINDDDFETDTLLRSVGRNAPLINQFIKTNYLGNNLH